MKYFGKEFWGLKWEVIRGIGFLGCIRKIITKIWSIIKAFLFGVKKENKTETKKEIFNCWEKEWKNVSGYIEQKDLFFHLFIDIYEHIQRKEKDNRMNNFKWKRLFIVMLAAGPVMVFIVNILPRIVVKIGFIFKIPFLSGLDNQIITEGLLEELFFGVEGVVLWIFIAFLIQKWLNVKKYQETWVRHSDQKLALEQEMIKFVYEIDGYEDQNTKRKLFVERCLEIWKINQKKFSDNMNNKEVPLMKSPEEFNFFKLK